MALMSLAPVRPRVGLLLILMSRRRCGSVGAVCLLFVLIWSPLRLMLRNPATWVFFMLLIRTLSKRLQVIFIG
jgi:hypothetical protein